MKITLRGKADSYFWKKWLRFWSHIARWCSLTVKVKDGETLYTFRPKSRNDIFRYTTYFTKEEGTLAWIRNNAKKGTVFFDIGANVGLYSLYAANAARGVCVFIRAPQVQFRHIVGEYIFESLGEIDPPRIPSVGQ